MLPTSLNPMVCRHEYSWSERRQIERCHKCGKARGGQRIGAPAETRVIDTSPEAPREPIAIAFPPASNAPVLVQRLEALVAGRNLSRSETLELVLMLIEDGQSSEPCVFGRDAAGWFASIHSKLNPQTTHAA